MSASIDESASSEPTLGGVLVVLAGRPGTGKTTIGRLLARRLRAACLRTDVIAAPMLLDGLTEDSARAGQVAFGITRDVATENLRAGVCLSWSTACTRLMSGEHRGAVSASQPVPASFR